MNAVAVSISYKCFCDKQIFMVRWHKYASSAEEKKPASMYNGLFWVLFLSEMREKKTHTKPNLSIKDCGCFFSASSVC